MINLKIQLSGEKTGEKLLRGLSEIPGWVAEYIREKTANSWDNSMSPGAVPWAPLGESTIEARRRRNISGIRPLIASGRMRASLRVVKGADSAMVVVDGPSLFHQKGTDRLPRRSIFPGADGAMPDVWKKDISEFVCQDLKMLLSES